MAKLRRKAPRTRVFKKERNYTERYKSRVTSVLCCKFGFQPITSNTPPPYLITVSSSRLRRRPLDQRRRPRSTAQNLSMALPWFYLLATGSAYWQLTRVRPHYARGCASTWLSFSSLTFFRAAIASGLVTVHLRTFSSPLPKRVVLIAFTKRMRL